MIWGMSVQGYMALSLFQYSNMYTVTSDIKKLYSDVHLQDQCLQSVAVKGE